MSTIQEHVFGLLLPELMLTFDDLTIAMIKRFALCKFSNREAKLPGY